MIKETARHYRLGYSPLTRSELIQKVASQMSQKRFEHVLRVEEMALILAKRYQCCLEKASIAALTHDYAKERPDDEMVGLIHSGDYPEGLVTYGNAIWHGIVGADIVAKELGITDSDILQAIRLHTTGASDMSLLAKVIYVADYVEMGRDFPVVQEARALALEDLDEAVAFETKQTLLYLTQKEMLIYPKTLETYNHWVVK